MKKKISKILGVGLTLIMVLSLSIAMSPPVFAGDNEWTSPAKPKQAGEDGDWFYSPDIGALGPIARAIDGSLYVYAGMGGEATLTTSGNATAEWETEQAHSGSSSAKLHAGFAGDDWAEVVLTPPTGITLDDMADITSGWSWWYYIETLGFRGTSLELHFEGPGSGYAEMTIMDLAYGVPASGGPPPVGAWTEQTIVSDTTTGLIFGTTEAGAPIAEYPVGNEGTIADLVAHMITEEPVGDAGAWVLTEVRPALGWIGASETTAYIDDVSIDGATYNLEGTDGTITPGLALRSYLMKSTDDGRSWDETDYHTDVAGGTVVDIAVSPVDADILYVADDGLVYVTDDAGDDWEVVSESSLGTALGGNEVITSIDVGYDRNDDPFVFIGTMDTVLYDGNVFYVAQVGYPAEWTPLDVGGLAAAPSTYDVYAVAVSPEFATTREIFALVTNAVPITAIMNNLNGSVGDWDIVGAELLNENNGAVDWIDPFESTAASRIQFPDDFDTDDAYEMFVGVCSSTGTGNGSVFRVTDADSYNLGNAPTGDTDIDVDVVSLDIIGSYGSTTMIAGHEDSAEVFISTDDGDSWDDPDKLPSGAGPSYVALDDDFDDNGIAWVATWGTECAVSLTIDSGALYNQISLIATDITSVESISFSRKYATDDTMFMVTYYDTTVDTWSIWRHASDWERVGVSTLAEFGAAVNQVQLSPGYPTDETVYVAQNGSDPVIYRSTDAGGDWKEIVRQPEDMLYGWVVVDEETIIVGGNGMVYWTDNHGRRVWEDDTLTGAGNIMSFSLSPNLAADETVLAGAASGEVWISEDLGEDWDQVEDDTIGAEADAYVSFDTGYADNKTIFAAAGTVVARCIIDTAEDWADQEWKEFTVPSTTSTTTEGADSFTVTFGDAADSFTLVESNGAVLLTSDDADLAYDAGNSEWTVDANAISDVVLVTAVGTAEPCTGVITTSANTAILTLDIDTDADTPDDIVIPDTIATTGTGSFILPDTEQEAASTATLTLTLASGLRAMPNGTLYVSDSTAGTGVWRTINSTADTIGDTLFELMNEDLGDVPQLRPLYITEGSNVLWALDGATANRYEVWTYTDFLADEVELDEPWSNTGIDDTSEVMLKWNELEGADLYQLEYSPDSSFDTKVLTVNDIEDEWFLVEGLEGGETYYWKVRVQAEDPLRSEWSRVWNFTMKLGKPAAPELAIPGPGAQDVILSPSFYWPSVTNAKTYEVEVATDTAFESLVASAEVSVNSWVCDTTLAYSTGYYWRVRALAADLVISGWRVMSFTTMPKAAAPTPPVTIAPAPPAPDITITVPSTPLAPIPMWVWAIIGIGGALVIAVIILIVRTRRAL